MQKTLITADALLKMDFLLDSYNTFYYYNENFFGIGYNLKTSTVYIEYVDDYDNEIRFVDIPNKIKYIEDLELLWYMLTNSQISKNND
jgi:hypothetical protein